ncbi:MAG TPA: hypothetical protein VM841_08315 [Actinomycetota bacterium]|nr:hypothetical protein [Actinomycetota bacterium]
MLLTTRTISRWLIAPLALAAALATGAPTSSTLDQILTATSGRVDLSATPAAMPAALAPLAGGQKVSAAQVNAAQSAASLSGSGTRGRLVVPIGDANGDNRPDLIDFRATNGTLSYRLLSSHNASTIWQAAPIVRPSTIHVAVYPAQINGGAMDVYLLEQHEADRELRWTLHAVDGATGNDIWATGGSLPTDTPDTTPPTVPPSSPPSIPSVSPSAIPSVIPSGVPAVPSIPPSGLPSVLPSDVPTTPPSGLPPLPGLPSEVPSELPSEVPSELPSGIPSEIPSDLPTTVPSGLPTPTISPPTESARQRAASQDSPVPFAAYVTGSAPADVDGDGSIDFALTQTVAFHHAGTTAVVSTLTTVAAASGAPLASVTAVGRDAVPAVAVGGDFLGTGSRGLLAVDEIATGNGNLVTYRAFTASGVPLFAASDSVAPGYVGVFDARHDLNGDGLADILINRYPSVPGTGPTQVAVRTAPLGQSLWSRTLDEAAIAFVGGSFDAAAGLDVQTQGLHVSAPGRIPSKVVYRALGGANGTSLYSRDVPVANGGGIGDWSAKLSPSAGRIDADVHPDMVHAVNAVPSDGLATQWSQAAVSAQTGALLWSRTSTLDPGAPVGGNVVGDAAADIVDVQESVTRTSDSLVIKTASGANGAPAWTSRVLVGGGTERVRDVHTQSMNPNGTGDIVITVLQRSGTRERTLIVGVRGATGQVLWIRTT